MIGNYEGDRLYDALNGKQTPDNGDAMAKVLGTDADGTVWVNVAGGSERTPLETINSEVEPGDVVSVRIGNAGAAAIGNISNPAASTRHVELVQQTAESALSKVGQARADAEMAKNAAAEAAAVAEAVGQHFWAADDGIHVTEIEQDEFVEDPSGANILENANGILLRDGETWLSQFTPGSVAFYDGEGNEAENVTAVFGANGARVGRDEGTAVAIRSTGINFYSESNELAGRISQLAATRVDESWSGGISSCYKNDQRLAFTTLHPFDFTKPMTVTLYVQLISPSEAYRYEDVLEFTEAGVKTATIETGHSYYGTMTFDVEVAGPPADAHVYVTYKTGTPSRIDVNLDLEYAVVKSAPLFEFGDVKGVTGAYSSAMGHGVKAVGSYSHAEGGYTESSGPYSHAEGRGSKSSGECSHAEGRITIASGSYAHAEGIGSEASGDYSHAQNRGTIAEGNSQTAIGAYNVADSSSLVIIGNGTNDDNRSNAMTVDWDGNMTLAGTLMDGDGRSLSDMEDYLPLAGGTLTGALSGTEAEFSSIAADTSELGDASAQGLIVGDATATGPSIQFLTENDSVNTRALIQAHDSGGTNGHNLVVRAGGTFVAGGGEYATQRYGLGDIAATENAYVGADNSVLIETNANTIANRRTWTFGTGGAIVGAQMVGIDSDVTPSARTDVNPFSWRDEDGTYIGQIRACQETDGRIGAALVARIGTTDTGGIKQNVLRLYADQAGNLTYSVSSPVNFRKAIGIENSTTSTVADIAAAAANFEITAAQYHTNGIVATAWVTVKTTNALTAGTTYTVATLVSGKRPFAGVTNGSFGTVNSVYGNADVTNGGALRVRLSANLAAGSSFRIGATYILA